MRRNPQQKMLWPKYKDVSFVARRTALVSFAHTKAYGRFVRFLRDDLWLDCCVYAGRYRLDYVQLEYGDPQYRLSRKKMLIGKVYIKPGQMTAVQRELAAYLMAAYGFTVRDIKPTQIRWNEYKRKSAELLAKKAG